MNTHPVVFSSIAIAVLGVTFLTTLLVRIIRTGKTQPGSLKRHRSAAEGVCDLLNWGSVIDNGVILNKNGSLMASWQYAGEDDDNSTDDDKNYVAAKLNQVFAALGDGWMLHCDNVRMETAKYIDSRLNHFPDKVSYAIEEERRRFFTCADTLYDSVQVLTLTYYPPLVAQAKFIEMFFEDDRKARKTPRATLILEKFKKDLAVFEAGLSSVFKMARLGGHDYEREDGGIVTRDEQLQFLQMCLTGKAQPVILPKNPVRLDMLLGGQELWGGIIPRIGDKFINVVSIEGFPGESYAGILKAIYDVPVNCRFSSRFIFLDRHQALAAAGKEMKKWKQKERGIVDVMLNRPVTPDRLNMDAVRMAQGAAEAITEIQSGEVAYGYYTPVVVLMDEDRVKLEESARQVVKAVNDLGFVARLESVNTLDAFMGSMPGHGVENVRRPHVSTYSFAHCIPTSSVWTGQATAPCQFYPPNSPPLMQCVTRGRTPYRCNLHVGDVGHTIIAGRTGGGKSVLLCTIAAQALRYPGAGIFAFDKGMSLYALCKATGGTHFEVAGEGSELCFAPFNFLETVNDRQWALDWIDKILGLNGFVTGPADRNEIAIALERLAEFGRHGMQVCLNDFLDQVQSPRVRETMRQYGADGVMGSLLAADADGLNLSRFTVFEVEKLMELGDKWALPVLDYIFRRIGLALKGQPALLLLDEAWLMLQHPVFAAKIREWLKVLRKANCAVVMATQNIEDFENSGLFTEIAQSTASKIFLPNQLARNEEFAHTYKRMGMNRQQINIIANATAKRHYYHATENGQRLFELALGPVARCFVAASDKETIQRIKALEANFGELWPEHWVREKTGLEFGDYCKHFTPERRT